MPDPGHLKDWAEVALYIVSIAAVLASAWTYRRNSARERSQWLYDLYQRFWDQQSLQEMRIHIDKGNLSFIQIEEPIFMPPLDNYLNFFEFVAYRWRKKELPKDEIDSMFGYFLHQIGTSSIFRAYLSKYGYEQLNALLDELRYSVS